MRSPGAMPARSAGPLRWTPATSAPSPAAAVAVDMTQPRAGHAPLGLQRRDDGLHEVARYREADAFGSAALRQDHGVDADQPAGGVDQRAARIAGVDGGVGLNEVVDRLGSPADDRADDALRHRLADAERIADREHDVADRDVVDVGELDGLQAVGVDLEEREVGRGVGAHDLRDVQCAVRPRHGKLRRLLDHVVVGDDVSVAIDHDAGPQSLLDHLGRERQR